MLKSGWQLLSKAQAVLHNTHSGRTGNATSDGKAGCLIGCYVNTSPATAAQPRCLFDGSKGSSVQGCPLIYCSKTTLARAQIPLVSLKNKFRGSSIACFTTCPPHPNPCHGQRQSNITGGLRWSRGHSLHRRLDNLLYSSSRHHRAGSAAVLCLGRRVCQLYPQGHGTLG